MSLIEIKIESKKIIDKLDVILSKLNKLDSTVTRVETKLNFMEKNIMSHFDGLVAAVDAQKTVVDSVVTLLAQLRADLAEHMNEPAEIAKIVENLDANTKALADAVANSPG